MVSIMILAIAILPMISMFDMGLTSATTGSKYDKARALANLKLEQAKGLPFDSTVNTVQDLKDNFPMAAGTTTTYNLNSNSRYVSNPMTQAGFTGFQYIIQKQYMKLPSAAPAAAQEDFLPCTPANSCTPPTTLIRVTVTVQWNGNTIKTLGLVAQSQ
jgi:hypothetical protein